MFSFTQNYLTRGFWGDEAWTSLISQLPYLQMLKTTAADFHPPGYYTIVELVYKFLPPTEIVTRSISIVFYLLTIMMVYKLAFLITNSTPEETKSTDSTEFTTEASEIIGRKRFWGIIATLVVTFNPIFFTYAFEARNYTMFAFAATGSIYSLIKLQKTDNWRLWWAVFVIFTALGIYTHYYMFFIIFAQGLYVMLFERKIFLKMTTAFVVIALLYLPWLPFLFSQVKSVGQDYWISPIDARTHFETILRILGGEQKNIYRPILSSFSVLLILIGVAQHAVRRRFEKSYILIWLWVIVPFILATLPGLEIFGIRLPFRPIFFWRYLIFTSIPLSILIVHTGQKIPKFIFVTTIAVVLALSLTIDVLTIKRYPYTFRQAYEKWILPEIKSEDKIVTVLPSFAEVAYYRNRFGLDNELVVLSEGLVQFSGKSLLDAYVANGKVRIDEKLAGDYFELRPGPSIQKME